MWSSRRGGNIIMRCWHSATLSWPSFLAGAISAQLMFFFGRSFRKFLIRRFFGGSMACWRSRVNEDRDESDNQSDANSYHADNPISDSTVRISKSFSKASMRWPWDTIRNKVLTASASFLNIDFPEISANRSEEISEPRSKTGPCIGAIFGLDVGGTLTKLVYFEQRIQEWKRLGSHEGFHRQEHYHAAASASEVLQARRSTSTLTRHNADSDVDLQSLWRLRQESLPDRLDQFASSCNMTGPGLLFSSDCVPKIRKDTTGSSSSSNNFDRPSQFERANAGGEIGMKKSASMVNLSKSSQRAEALDNFYSFARRLDTYETGVKDKHLSYYSRYLNGEFHFIRFETRRMKNAMNLMRINNFHLNIKEIGATGGGAHKFAGDWEQELGIIMAKQDEMNSLVAGMQFVMSDIVGECYTFKPTDWSPRLEPSNSYDDKSSAVNGSLLRTPDQLTNEKTTFPDPGEASFAKQPLMSHESNARPCLDQWWASRKVQRDFVMDGSAFPYLLVSIGTGVSILRVDGPRKHERISGSTIGGGTYWGLCRLLTGSDSFSDVLNLAMKGDPSKVDMMVGDIYGRNSDALEKIGLPSNIVASSFGKLVAKQNPSEGIKEEDLARALLLMVTNNIGQVAHLNAQLHKISRIFFVGTFLQHNTISQQRLAHAIDYWSRGKMEALFLEHEGYFGAFGAFLLNQGIAHDGSRPSVSNSKDGKSKKCKRLSGKNKFHRRSKSTGSITSASTSSAEIK